ncbi:Fic family protein [Candidatus Uhrbacteria bacterium]|nr:Fic family protein [Candidatus Uhrbacteria bacterium]
MSRRPGETSYRDTAFGIIPRSKLIPLEIEGIKRAWDFVLEMHAAGRISITLDSLREIHRVGFGWIFPDLGGRFRTVDVEVSDHKPPKFFIVPQLMLDFCRDIEERLRHLPSIENPDFLGALITLLAWAHHRFLWIHPFQDYNGRMARLLINIILLNLDLPPVELKVETKSGRHRYIQALQAGDNGDYRLLERIIKRAIAESVAGLR